MSYKKQIIVWTLPLANVSTRMNPWTTLLHLLPSSGHSQGPRGHSDNSVTDRISSGCILPIEKTDRCWSPEASGELIAALLVARIEDHVHVLMSPEEETTTEINNPGRIKTPKEGAPQEPPTLETIRTCEPAESWKELPSIVQHFLPQFQSHSETFYDESNLRAGWIFSTFCICAHWSR